MAEMEAGSSCSTKMSKNMWSCNVVLEQLTGLQERDDFVSLQQSKVETQDAAGADDEVSNADEEEDESSGKLTTGPAGLNGSYWKTPTLPTNTSVSRWKVRREEITLKKQKQLEARAAAASQSNKAPRKRKRTIDPVEEEDRKIIECHGPKRKCQGNRLYNSKTLNQSTAFSKHIPAVQIPVQSVDGAKGDATFANIFSKDIEIPKIRDWMMGTTATKRVPFQERLILSRDGYIEYRRNQFNDTSSETSSVTSSSNKLSRNSSKTRQNRARTSSTATGSNTPSTPQKDAAAEKSAIEFEKLRRSLFEKRHPGCFDSTQATNEKHLVLNEADLKDSTSPFLSKEMISQSQIFDKISSNTLRDLTPLFVSQQMYNESCKSTKSTSKTTTAKGGNKNNLKVVIPKLEANNTYLRSAEDILSSVEIENQINSNRDSKTSLQRSSIPRNGVSHGSSNGIEKTSLRRKLKLVSYAAPGSQEDSGGDGTDSDSVESCNETAKAVLRKSSDQSENNNKSRRLLKSSKNNNNNDEQKSSKRFIHKYSSAGSFIKKILQNGGILPDNVI